MRTVILNALRAAIAAATIAGLHPAHAQAPGCGTDEKITIAEMTWLSAATLAHITNRILRDGYGCQTLLVPGDTVPTATSMLAKSEPMIAPELWLSTSDAIWEKILAKGNAFKAGDVFTEGGTEGWFIPDYVAKANPGLKTVADLPAHASLFTEVASNGKGRLYACPPGWACEITNANLFRALGLGEQNFELFSPGSGANLKASIARKVTRRQPVLAYYWGPTAVIRKFNLVPLGMPPYDEKAFECLASKDCADPKPSGFKRGEVAIAVVTDLREKAPAVVQFLSKMRLPNETVNDVLAWGDDQSASPDDIAVHFLERHAGIWKQWVPDEVAAKVQARL